MSSSESEFSDYGGSPTESKRKNSKRSIFFSSDDSTSQSSQDLDKSSPQSKRSKKSRKTFENGYKRIHFFLQINGDYRKLNNVDLLPTRDQLFEILISKNEVTGCVVAHEKGSQGVRANLKVFVLAKKRKITKDIVIEWLSDHIRSLSYQFLEERNRKNIMRRISATDIDLLHHGVDVHEFSYQWAVMNRYLRALEKGTKFDPLHEFVLSHHRYAKSLESLHNQYVSNQKLVLKLRKIINLEDFVGWRLKTVKLFNQIIEDLRNGSWHKMNHIFIWGPPNVGKSFFIYRMLMDLFENDQVYEPYTTSNGPTERTFSTFNPDQHVILIDNEFRIGRYDVEVLKRLMEGANVKIRALFQEPKDLKMRIPFIFLSNVDVRKEIDKLCIQGVEERMTIIHAKGPKMDKKKDPMPVFRYENIQSDAESDGIPGISDHLQAQLLHDSRRLSSSSSITSESFSASLSKPSSRELTLQSLDFISKWIDEIVAKEVPGIINETLRELNEENQDKRVNDLKNNLGADFVNEMLIENDQIEQNKQNEELDANETDKEICMYESEEDEQQKNDALLYEEFHNYGLEIIAETRENADVREQIEPPQSLVILDGGLTIQDLINENDFDFNNFE